MTLFTVDMCNFLQGLDVRLCSGLRCVTLFRVGMCDFVCRLRCVTLFGVEMCDFVQG